MSGIIAIKSTLANDLMMYLNIIVDSCSLIVDSCSVLANEQRTTINSQLFFNISS